MRWPTQRDLRRISVHDVIVFLIGAILGRYIIEWMEATYGDAPWWGGALIYALTGIACNLVYFGIGLEFGSRRDDD